MTNFTEVAARPLNHDQIRSIAPSVFADRPWSGVSSRYTFIPTSMVVTALETAGWAVMSVRQQRVHLEDNRMFSKHILRFRQIGAAPLLKGDVFPEIVLSNSHNRNAAYNLYSGLYRLACANGLVVDDTTFERVAIRHSGEVVDEVMTGIERAVKNLPKLAHTVSELKAIDLTEDERGVFASAARTLRPSVEEHVPSDLLLRPRRQDDVATDLWTTFQTVQENLTKGGQWYYGRPVRTAQGHFRARRQTVRPVKSIDKDTALNRSLWTLAMEMAKIKTGHAIV